MLLVRRRAPEGSYFADGDRASGVFGVIATGFSVLLGFIIFLAFTSYDNSRSGAETEALIVAQQVRDRAVLAGRAAAGTVGGSSATPATSSTGWARLEAGTVGDRFNPWGVAHVPHAAAGRAERSPTEQAASTKWLDQTSDRTAARQDRIHAREGVSRRRCGSCSS